ncbi:MAG: Xaa-Pro peptidase family protein [Actinomycetota bacterium]
MPATQQRATPPRGFTDEEFANRTERCQAQMAERDLAALLVCTEPEVRYFTGFHTPFWQSPTRPWFVVVPAAGKPIAVIPSIGGASMSTTWLDDVRTWSSPQPEDDGISLLVDCLTEVGAGSSGGQVGLPMGPETHVRMPLADLDALRERVGGFVDATDIIRSLRMVKSEAEVDKHRYICGVVSDAFEALPTILSTGMTEREAFQTFRAEIVRQGADDVPYLVGATGPGGIDDIIRQPSDRTITKGDLLIFDTGSTFDGYFSDFDRNFAFGSADQGAKDAYRAVWESTEAGLTAVRPGATTTEVFTAMNEVLKANGSLGNDVGRMGHGLGMQVTEWPSHTDSDDTVIEENMVLTLEPGLVWADGKAMVHEENLVVRADGPELLSRRAAPELPIIDS